MNFNFYLPTRIIAGRNCVLENSLLLGDMGRKAFIMTGKSSAERNGSLGDVTKALAEREVEWVHYNKVKPNPSLEDVRSASEEARESGADFVIAIGGGSPMDAAKAVAVLAACDISDDDLLNKRQFPKVLPLVAIPTTAGTGSEVTPYSILTNDKLKTKSFLNSQQIYPQVAFLDGRYTMDLPQDITGATVIDALSHSAEGYLAVRAIPPGRIMALESLRLIGANLADIAEGKRLTLDQRQELLYASMLAGIVISQSGTTAVHAMGYSLTYFKGMDHGHANGLLMAAYFEFVQKERPEEVESLLEALGVSTIKEFKSYMDKILKPETLAESEVEMFSSIAVNAGNIVNTDPRPEQEDLKQMYLSSFTTIS